MGFESEPTQNGRTQDTLTNDSSEHTPDIQMKREISWPSVLFYIHLHILGIYGIFVLFSSTSFLTIVFTIFLILFGILGVTAGSHRLWAHRTYTASATLRVFLMICQTLAGQGSIYDWVRVHRFHHKSFGTDCDPFYSKKNFISAQVRAQIETYTPEQQRQLDMIDMSDMESDKVVMFQKKFYWILFAVLHVLLPINAPLEYWGDSFPAAIFVTFSLRYLIVLNTSWLITSAHFIWGLDKNFKPSDSNLIFLITKSYWPQYHYLLPCDYQTGEFGDYAEDCTTIFIRIFAAMGHATDLKTVTSDAVKMGLTSAVETGKDIVKCIESAAGDEMKNIPTDHYLNKTKYM